MSSSIASSRRGRPTSSRNGDFISLSSDFETVIAEWRRTEGLTFDANDEFEVDVVCLAGGTETGTHWGIDGVAELNEFYVLNINIRRGPDGINVYKLKVTESTRGNVVMVRTVIIDSDGEEDVDILTCPLATPEEISAALNWEPEPEPAPEPEPVKLRRIPRNPDEPGVSHMGFTISGAEQRVRLTGKWTCAGFYLDGVKVIGNVLVPGATGCVEMKVFDADGNLRLSTHVFRDRPTEFDAERLERGDYLLAFRAESGSEASGSYSFPNCRMIAELPDKPVIDEILFRPQEWDSGRTAVPKFVFTAS